MAQAQDFKGPYAVSLNVPKLEAKKKGFLSSSWKQAFAFIYPGHKRALLHISERAVFRVQFKDKKDPNPSEMIALDKVDGKKHVLIIRNIQLNDEDNKPLPHRGNIEPELAISFFDAGKRAVFEKILSPFVLNAKEIEKAATTKKRRLTKDFRAAAPTGPAPPTAI